MKSVNGIKNGRIMTPDGIIENGSILIKGGKIAAVEESGGVEFAEGAEIVDAAGKWALPGFIDLHCHGAKGCDVMDATLSDVETIARYHAGGGVTAFLPTTASKFTRSYPARSGSYPRGKVQRSGWGCGYWRAS